VKSLALALIAIEWQQQAFDALVSPSQAANG